MTGTDGRIEQGTQRAGARRAAMALVLAPSLCWSALAHAQTTGAGAGAGIDSDLVQPGATAAPAAAPPAAGAGYSDPTVQPHYAETPVQTTVPANGCPINSTTQTYSQGDLIAAAESVFGKGAQGLAVMIRDILAKQGQPNGYIVGREASGAIGVGLRYGSGMLCNTALGRSPIYWTGPSIGFDFGGSAAKTFVLVYNLYKPEELYRRFVAGEGQAYLVGGFHVSYLRHGNVVLIPVRMGVGLRLGINGGYMKITRNLNYLPF